jgi:branched-chain amino acid transport system substrate-binding protein
MHRKTGGLTHALAPSSARALLLVVLAAAWAQPVGAAERTVAVVAPLSGPYETAGGAMREAAQAASARVNGTGNDAVRLTFDDDGCEAGKAAAVATEIAARKPDAVVGHPCSSAAIAAAPIYAAAGIAFVTPGARHPDLTDKRAGPLVFRLAGRDDRQGEEAAAWAQREAGGRPVAILHDRTFHMSTLAAAVAGRITQAGGQAAQFPFVASELDYSALAARVADLGSGALGAVVYAGYPQEAILILRALRERGVRAPFLGTDAVATDEFGAASAAGRPVFVLRPAGGGPVGIAARTDAAVEVVGEAIRARAGRTLAETIAARSTQTHVLGPVSFDAKGDVLLPSYAVAAWTDGRWSVTASGPETGKP